MQHSLQNESLDHEVKAENAFLSKKIRPIVLFDLDLVKKFDWGLFSRSINILDFDSTSRESIEGLKSNGGG